jgi:hypothetical protein
MRARSVTVRIAKPFVASHTSGYRVYCSITIWMNSSFDNPVYSDPEIRNG